MNAIATIEPEAIALALPDDLAFDAWKQIGADLFQRQRNTSWLLADWWKHGAGNFRDEPQFALLLEQTAADPKRLSAMAKVAEAFPPHMRAGSLSFEVHREIASVTTPDDRLAMIGRADKERWTERTAHAEVVQYRYTQGSLLPEDDPENREAVEIIRAWNRASKGAREYAYALMPKGFGAINEGEVQ
ncbi:hypothetical protein [Sphingomonas faeni]|uniref:hypothetical protein n=1 Tax=Sphingomonas faeni TaxID=185950 RepID=UPI003353BB26